MGGDSAAIRYDKHSHDMRAFHSLRLPMRLTAKGTEQFRKARSEAQELGDQQADATFRTHRECLQSSLCGSPERRFSACP